MSENGPAPACAVCDTRTVRLAQHGAGASLFWLCGPCEDAGDALVTPPGTPLTSELMADASAAQRTQARQQ